MKPRSLGRGAATNLLPPTIAILLIFGAWEGYARLVLESMPGGSRFLPAPTAILASLFTNAADITPHAVQTFVETAIGFALAIVVGFVFAVILDVSPVLRRAIYPLLVASQTIPILALAPLLVLWFGFGILPKILIVGLVCFFPIVVAGADGFRATDPELVKLFKTFGASKLTIFRQVQFPGALPYLFSGLRISITYSVTGAIWGEYVGAQYGLGIFMQRKQHIPDIVAVFAIILVISAMSIAFFLLASLVERIVIPWHFRGNQQAEK